MATFFADGMVVFRAGEACGFTGGGVGGTGMVDILWLVMRLGHVRWGRVGKMSVSCSFVIHVSY